MFYGWEKVEQEQVLILLLEVRQLFSDKEKWVFWPIAIDGFGNEIDPKSKLAMSWSLLGACDLFTQQYSEPLASFISCATREYLNDLTQDNLIHARLGFEEEIELLDLAILDLQDDKQII